MIHMVRFGQVTLSCVQLLLNTIVMDLDFVRLSSIEIPFDYVRLITSGFNL